MSGEVKLMPSYAWTATEGYKHYPPYVNISGNRIAVRGVEAFNGKHYEPGLYAEVALPPQAIDELRAALTRPTVVTDEVVEPSDAGAIPGSHPADQAPSGLGASRFDPERKCKMPNCRKELVTLGLCQHHWDWLNGR